MPKKLQQLYSRRSFMTFSLKVGLTSLLAGRLFYLQVWKSDHYKTLSNGNRIRLVYSCPRRGILKDRNLKVLAGSRKNFRVIMYRDEINRALSAKDKICQIVDIDPTSFEEIVNKARKLPRSIPMMIRDNLDWDTVAEIEVNSHELPGIKIEEGEVRSYPLGDKASSILGYVSPPNQEEAQKNMSLSLPGVKIGKKGIEKVYDEHLFGEHGFSEVEVNSRGQIVRELKKQPSLNGHDLVLSLDRTLQERFHDRLSQEESASAVLIKIEGREVLAMASFPACDPNAFVNGVPHSTWNEWIKSPYHPLLNKTIQAEYAPGSIFKCVVALAALEHGIINQNSHVFCPGHYELGNHRYHCWKKHGHGNVDVVAALQHSCDVFFYQVARKLGIEKISETARKMGFGQNSGIEVFEEKIGLVPDKTWKKKRHGKSWAVGDTVVAGIGQGYLLATPMQMAQLAATLADKGSFCEATLLLNKRKDKKTSESCFTPHNINLIQEGLYKVVKEGTARTASLGVEGWSLAGKTSTTQVRRMTKKEREFGFENVPWHHRDHAMFMGFAPYENPKYALSIVVEHGGWGSKAAVPIARDLMKMVYAYDQGMEI